jgi:hypothetical protein
VFESLRVRRADVVDHSHQAIADRRLGQRPH